ncbi:pre-RNA processing PIH1/Nop17-domain-containing protein [Boletus coccyginus]|nr:pre-RNA processing PIH1/Nop17-domain-containing protein [Boletus coccyginus]
METATPDRVAVALNPVPGFCVKSRATNDSLVRITAPDSDQPRDIRVEKGLKIFVNIAWDPSVPPPPPASDNAIHRAMRGLDIDQSNSEAWFVPIVLSDARQDSDKAGQLAIVFDCVLNPSIKSRSLKDPGFKSFIIELAFQRIEAQTTLVLSRQIGTPNIASKGNPPSRRALVSAALYPPGHRNHQAPQTLVQEITDRPTSVPDKAPPKGILKRSAMHTSETRVPVWFWTKLGSSLRIVFDVPGVTHAAIRESTLDVEPRRILLHIPAMYDLDLNLNAPDSELSTVFGGNGTVDEALRLKRMRNLDVDNARAEWSVADKAIVLLA